MRYFISWVARMTHNKWHSDLNKSINCWNEIYTFICLFVAFFLNQNSYTLSNGSTRPYLFDYHCCFWHSIIKATTTIGRSHTRSHTCSSCNYSFFIKVARPTIPKSDDHTQTITHATTINTTTTATKHTVQSIVNHKHHRLLLFDVHILHAAHYKFNSKPNGEFQHKHKCDFASNVILATKFRSFTADVSWLLHCTNV